MIYLDALDCQPIKRAGSALAKADLQFALGFTLIADYRINGRRSIGDVEARWRLLVDLEDLNNCVRKNKVDFS